MSVPEISMHNVVAVFTSSEKIDTGTTMRHLCMVGSDGNVFKTTLYGHQNHGIKIQEVSDPDRYNAAADTAYELSKQLKDGTLSAFAVATLNDPRHFNCSGSGMTEEDEETSE